MCDLYRGPRARVAVAADLGLPGRLLRYYVVQGPDGSLEVPYWDVKRAERKAKKFNQTEMEYE